MIVAHVGPPLARLGGPAGYLAELERASRAAPPSAHRVRFPAAAQPGSAAPRRRLAGLRRALGRARRAALGPPQLFRPDPAALRTAGGPAHAHMERLAEDVLAQAEASLAAAVADADLVVAHDPFCAARALERRRSGQRVWMMGHCPMPIALYAAWSWMMPEWPWTDLAALPDVRRWVDWELEVWRDVDGVLVPSREAGGELARVDPRFAAHVGRAHCVLTGAAAPAERWPGLSRAELRRRFGLPLGDRIGLFLGNDQPYRGLAALLDGFGRCGDGDRGCLAVAGPPPERIPARRGLRALGPVDAVGDLLRAVDFVVNVNRFCLFDLSTIEAAGAGLPLLLHGVGGNLSVAGLGAGVVVLDDLEPATIARGLRSMWTQPRDRLTALGAASRACWARHLAPERLWARHLALYDDLAAPAGAGARGA